MDVLRHSVGIPSKVDWKIALKADPEIASKANPGRIAFKAHQEKIA
jgi:hypothetical protein